MASTVLWDGLKTSLNGLFQKEYKAASQTSLIGKFATQVGIKTKIGKYGFLGTVEKTKEFEIERQVSALLNQPEFLIATKKWENTIGVSVDDMNDGQLGEIQLRVASLGEEAANHPGRYLTEVREANGKCYDGKALYADDHPKPKIKGGAVQDNLLPGSGITLTHLKTDMKAAKLALLGYMSNTGLRLNNDAMRFAVVVPPALEFVAREMLKAVLVGGGNTNVFQGIADLVVDNNLTDDNDWFVDIVGVKLRSFIYQLREVPKIEVDKTRQFATGQIFYGASARYNIAPGAWYRTVKIENA